ncbi:OLC1v1007990C1 [Oldenlandia corymbosa var. corymbosa]|uniref:OLC1v1007990C1 n=1 Tax=Oldenlandia corymbosa var. corymbosa TaxID=529605 RepID=A0AAV1DNS5_OLDCO|nr:OLC1v1007990C1 [Oldenlandia corymbosa var. corymbosa]
MPVTIPRGFRFSPTDQELLKYLECKVMGTPLPYDHVISDDIDVYSPESLPEALINRYGNEEKVVYVFTRLKKVTMKGTNFDRKVGECTWKPNGRAKPIKDGEPEKVVGKFKTLSFVKEGVKSGYIMKEFTLNGSEEYALCQIYKKPEKEKANLPKDKVAKQEEVDAKSDDQNQLPYYPGYVHQVQNEAIDTVPPFISSETSLDHHHQQQHPWVHDLDSASAYGDPMQQELLGESMIHNMQEQQLQQQQDNRPYDANMDLFLTLLNENHHHGMPSLQQSPELDRFPLDLTDYQPWSTPRSSYFPYSIQHQMAEVTESAPGTQQTKVDQLQEYPNHAMIQMIQASNMSALLHDHQEQYMLANACYDQAGMESMNAMMMNPSYAATLMRVDDKPKPENHVTVNLAEIDDPIMTTKESCASFIETTNEGEMGGNRQVDCSDFGMNLATILRGSMEEYYPLPEQDPMVDNNYGLDRLKDFVMPNHPYLW